MCYYQYKENAWHTAKGMLMKNLKRLGVYLLINIIVSAVTTIVVLMLWTRNNPDAIILDSPSTPLPTVISPLGSNASQEESATATARVLYGEAVAGQLEINSVIAPGDLEAERVIIKHVGTLEISLAGWYLRDQQGNTYTFPALTMYSGASTAVYSKAGNNSVNELYWGLVAPVWEPGETILLFDPLGNAQASYTVP